MKVVSDIFFSGKNTDEVYNLPCVLAITKDRDGKPAAILSKEHTKGRTIARIGDHICQYESGLWQVYGSEAADKIIKGGKYAHE